MFQFNNPRNDFYIQIYKPDHYQNIENIEYCMKKRQSIRYRNLHSLILCPQCQLISRQTGCALSRNTIYDCRTMVLNKSHQICRRASRKFFYQKTDKMSKREKENKHPTYSENIKHKVRKSCTLCRNISRQSRKISRNSRSDIFAQNHCGCYIERNPTLTAHDQSNCHRRTGRLNDNSNNRPDQKKE